MVTVTKTPQFIELEQNTKAPKNDKQPKMANVNIANKKVISGQEHKRSTNIRMILMTIHWVLKKKQKEKICHRPFLVYPLKNMRVDDKKMMNQNSHRNAKTAKNFQFWRT